MSDIQTPESATAPKRERAPRPDIVGPDVPPAPYPIFMTGVVERGFGRGGKDLGCPTANLSDDALKSMTDVTTTGIYFGYARVHPVVEATGNKGALTEVEINTHPMVMSLGWNPFYKNEKMTAEIHIMKNFASDFYGHRMSVVVLGYIRPELDYTSREALIEDIETDKRVALKSLSRPAYERWSNECPVLDGATKS